MDLSVPYKNVTDKETAFNKVKEAITPETIARFKVTADVKADDKAKTITAKGSGFEIKISFTDDKAQVKLELSMLYRAFKGPILEGLEKQLKRVV